MVVHQLPITTDPILERMAATLSGLDPDKAARRVQRAGDWFRDINLGPPSEDRSMPASYAYTLLPEVQREFARTLPADVVARAVHYYPAGGGMGWHSNSNKPGWRVYVPRLLDAPAKSGTITRSGYYPDREGFANAFLIDTAGDSWHAIYALGRRLSIGLWLAIDSPRMNAWLGLKA